MLTHKTNTDAFNFTAAVASRGYHVFKTTSTSWINAKVGDKVTVELEMTGSSLENRSNACAIRTKKKYFSNLTTIGRIPKWNFTACSLFRQDRRRKLMGMPSGGLEISLQLLFSNEQRENLDIMNALVNSLYD